MIVQRMCTGTLNDPENVFHLNENTAHCRDADAK
jgi:hypothetical protein